MSIYNRIGKYYDVIVACEFSGIARDAFLRNGFDAISVDLLATESPGPHYQGDVLEFLSVNSCSLLIAHPPCTYLCNSAVFRLHRDQGRQEKMEKAADFFRELLYRDEIPCICVENPVMHGYGKKIIGMDQAQTIQPYQYGHDASKRTCLWLKNLPPLNPTKIISPTLKNGRYIYGNQTPSGQNKIGPGPDRAKIRSRTYAGIAAAMANQWGDHLKQNIF